MFLSFRNSRVGGWLQALSIISRLRIIAYAVIPQTTWLLARNRGVDRSRVFQHNDVFKSEWMKREQREPEGTPAAPGDIPSFLTNSDAVLRLNTTDAKLLEATWQHFQTNSQPLITLTRLSEVSTLGFSGNISKDVGLLSSFLIYTAVYGSIHFMGLNTPFRNEMVKTWWEISSIVVITGVAVAGLVVYPNLWLFRRIPYHGWPVVGSWLDARLALRPASRTAEAFFILTLGLVVMSIIGASLAAYLAARFFLIVESFTALTHQPRAVYEVRPWAAYWPHIS